MTANEFREKLGAARIAYGGVNSPDELARHRALTHCTLRNTAGEAMELPVSPLVAANDMADEKLRAPRLGEHSDAIRNEFSD